jgi:hypothetical protein
VAAATKSFKSPDQCTNKHTLSAREIESEREKVTQREREIESEKEKVTQRQREI